MEYKGKVIKLLTEVYTVNTNKHNVSIMRKANDDKNFDTIIDNALRCKKW